MAILNTTAGADTVGRRDPKPVGRGRTILVWTLQVLAAAAFLAAGSFKLMGNPMMVQIFDHIGIGQWFRIVTGSVEIAGALLLLLPATAAFGGVLLAATMGCAILTHLAVIGGNPLPAIVLLLITATVAWLRRDSLRATLGGIARPQAAASSAR